MNILFASAIVCFGYYLYFRQSLIDRINLLSIKKHTNDKFNNYIISSEDNIIKRSDELYSELAHAQVWTRVIFDEIEEVTNLLKTYRLSKKELMDNKAKVKSLLYDKFLFRKLGF